MLMVVRDRRHFQNLLQMESAGLVRAYQFRVEAKCFNYYNLWIFSCPWFLLLGQDLKYVCTHWKLCSTWLEVMSSSSVLCTEAPAARPVWASLHGWDFPSFPHFRCIYAMDYRVVISVGKGLLSSCSQGYGIFLQNLTSVLDFSCHISKEALLPRTGGWRK